MTKKINKVFYNVSISKRIPAELKEKQTCVLGGQGQIWTEYITNSNCLEYRAFPRIYALSEVLWSFPENKSYPEFLERLQLNLGFLDSLQINYRKLKKKQTDFE